MVEANSDQAVVTAVILRESREAAAAHAAQTSAPKATAMRYAHIPVRNRTAAETAAAVAVEQPKQDAPAPASAGFFNVQLFFAMALVAVLLVVWVAERRSVRKNKEGEHGR